MGATQVEKIRVRLAEILAESNLHIEAGMAHHPGYEHIEKLFMAQFPGEEPFCYAPSTKIEGETIAHYPKGYGYLQEAITTAQPIQKSLTDYKKLVGLRKYSLLQDLVNRMEYRLTRVKVLIEKSLS
jgi:hypothetical protein